MKLLIEVFDIANVKTLKKHEFVQEREKTPNDSASISMLWCASVKENIVFELIEIQYERFSGCDTLMLRLPKNFMCVYLYKYTMKRLRRRH